MSNRKKKRLLKIEDRLNLEDIQPMLTILEQEIEVLNVKKAQVLTLQRIFNNKKKKIKERQPKKVKFE